MKRLTRFAVLGMVLAVACAADGGRLARAADPLQIPGTIDAVTVYRGQALVTRLVDVPGPAGLKEVMVTDLPDQVEPGSIYAEGSNGMEVQSVSYSVRPVANDVRAEVQKLDEQIKALQDKITANQRQHQVIQSNRDYLAKLAQFTAATSTTELSKGVLNAETLMKLSDYQSKQTQDLSDEELKADMALRDLNEQLQTLQRQRAQIAGGSAKVAREAHVYVQVPAAGARMQVRYVVDNASWSPSYNVRVTTGGAKPTLAVEYMASIQQLTGEDWGNVKMTLSTATPSLLAKAPVLNELAITSARGGQTPDVLQQLEQGGSTQARQDLQQQKTALENFRGTIGNTYTGSTVISGNQAAQSANTININGNVVNLDYIGDNNDVDLILNKTAGDLQLLDLLAKEKIARAKESKPAPLTPDDGLVVTYDLKNRTSLLSRSDRQLIQIDTLDMTANADFYKVACPVLSTFVYDEASAVNASPRVLLQGDINTYMNNEFVGRGVMPSVTSGQRFTVGLGIDSSMRTRRELVEKTDTPQGGNRVVNFTYRLWIENFGDKPASVHLLDRLPKAKEEEIKVEPVVSTDPKAPKMPELSKDPIYEQTDKKNNIWRWDISVPAQARDDKAYSLEYQFKLEYAATAVISTPAPAATPPGQTSPNGGGGFGGGGRGGAGGGGGGFGGGGAGGGRGG